MSPRLPRVKVMFSLVRGSAEVPTRRKARRLSRRKGEVETLFYINTYFDFLVIQKFIF